MILVLTVSERRVVPSHSKYLLMLHYLHVSHVKQIPYEEAIEVNVV